MPTKASPRPNAPAAAAPQSPTLKPTKMPIPPRLGVAEACQRSVEGTDTTHLAAGDRRSAQIATEAAGKARVASAVPTAAEPNRTPLAGCEGRRRAPGRAASASGLPGPSPRLAPMAVYADLVRYRELFANLFRRDFQAK